ncbi:hypothetical protein M413DRAFT_18290 [Hebeloma cylindrosporum]|uniref:DUF2415 domain-containing protein n=1 Tax=Hebeloma cylindrosporum TaxID=76867 RepID=A0A0C3CGA2_HEBCY|nr:hypothetical protein M413DRAFT_18290 [Hebeloma cylindrosporum h7]
MVRTKTQHDGAINLKIHLWDFYQEDVRTPSYTLRGPKGNIFCLQFSSTNKFLYAAGTCETVFKFDISYLGSAMDSIRAITCHPTQDEVFMSASEDGTVRYFDERQRRRGMSVQDIIQTENEMTGVQYHPTIEHLFATSDGAGRVMLRDFRMAFGPLVNRTDGGVVQRYNTKITKATCSHLCNPDASSFTFDREGTKLAVTFLNYLPAIYSLSDPNPIAVLSGQNLPDGSPIPPKQRTYKNSCTMKHGSFGGPAQDVDDMYAGGSDDFRGYVWRIPSVSQLTAVRNEISASEWETREMGSSVAFSEGRKESKFVPYEISTPLCRLTGHKSIVNTALFHPHFLHVVTAGVEKNLILHSPTPSSPCTQNLPPSPANVRELRNEDDDEDRANYLSALLGVQPLTVGDVDEAAERQTLSLFDHIIREEGDVDVFVQRRWRTPDSSESEHSSGSEEDDEEPDRDSDLDNLFSAVRPHISFLT